MNNSSATIIHNEFEGIYNKEGFYNRPYYGAAIAVDNKTGTGHEVVIDDGGSTGKHNIFTDVNIGVKAVSVCSTCSLTVAGNEFINTSYNMAVGTNYHNTAIDVQRYIRQIPNNSPSVFIYGNEITDFRIGIHALHIDNLHCGIDASGNFDWTGNPNDPDYRNRIHFNLDTDPDISKEHIGIFLQSCPDAHVVSNLIENDEAATGTGLFRGMDLEVSPDGRINCNEITNIPFSMRFFGDCDGTILRTNVMTEYDEAVHLDAAQLPEQKQIDGSGNEEPANNQWYDAGGSYRVDGTSLNPNFQIKWFYDDINNTGQFIPDPANFAVVAPEPDNPPGSVECDDFTDLAPRDQRYGAVVDDSLQFVDYVSENTWRAWMSAYAAMRADTTLIYQDEDRDTVYQAFFENMSQTNLALFDSVIFLAGDTATLDEAISLNESIEDTNDIEYYLKTVLDVYLNTLAQGQPMDAADSSLCNEVSVMDFMSIGEAVFMAAGMAGREIHCQYSPARLALLHPPDPGQPLKQSAQAGIGIHPNPASGSFQISGDLKGIRSVQVLAADGTLAGEFRPPFEPYFPMSHVAPGLYCVKIIAWESKPQFFRLIIIR